MSNQGHQEFVAGLQPEYTDEDRERRREDYVKCKSQNYIYLYRIPLVRTYYAYVASALMMELSRPNLQLHCRFKSEDGISPKIRSRIKHAYFIPGTDIFTVNTRQFYDGFAMKIIVPNNYVRISDSSEQTSSGDSELDALMQARNNQNAFLQKMKIFGSRLTDDMFLGEIRSKREITLFEVSKQDYVQNCIDIVKQIISVVNPEATELLQSYDEQQQALQNTLGLLRSLGDNYSSSPIDESFVDSIQPNFLELYNSYFGLINNDLGSNVVVKAVIDKCNSNQLLNRLGVSFSFKSKESEESNGSNVTEEQNPKVKQKPNGFSARYIYLNTLFGPIELQIQTAYEYELSKYGLAAHGSYKKVPEISLEDPDCKSKILRISPSKGEATFKQSPANYTRSTDEEDHGLVQFIVRSEFDNYISILSEQPKGTSIEVIKAQKQKLREMGILSQELTVKEFTYADFEQYIDGPEYDAIRQLSTVWNLAKPINGQLFSQLLQHSRGKLSPILQEALPDNSFVIG